MENDYAIGTAKSLASATNPKRESELTRVLGALHQEISFSEKIFEDLSLKISPILRNELLKEANQKIDEPEYSSSLAQDINSAVRKISSLNKYIISIKDRVEL